MDELERKFLEKQKADAEARLRAAASALPLPSPSQVSALANGSPVVDKARELAAVPLAQAGSVALAAQPLGVGPRDVLALGEKAGVVKRREAPPADPDKPETDPAAAPEFGALSALLPPSPAAGGAGRAPSPIGQQQVGRHVVEGRQVPQEAKDLYERGFQSQIEGVAANDKALEREGQSREAWAANQAAEMDKLEMRRQLLAKQKEDALKALDDQVKARLDEARSPGVVANRTVGRLVSGIGLALGAYSASMRGGPNLALQIYQQHVNEEAAELERQAKHEENLYSRMYRSFGDKEQALAMTRAALHERGLFEIGKIEAAAKTEHGRAALKGLAGQLQSSRGDNISRTAEIENDKVERTASESAHVFGPMSRDPLGLHGTQVEAPAGEATSGEAYDAVRGAVQEAHDAVQKSQGPTGGWLPTEGQIRRAQEAAAEEAAPAPTAPPGLRAAPAPMPGQRQAPSLGAATGGPAPTPAAPPDGGLGQAKARAWAAYSQLSKKDRDGGAKDVGDFMKERKELVSSVAMLKAADSAFPTGKSQKEMGDVLAKAKANGLNWATDLSYLAAPDGASLQAKLASGAVSGVAAKVATHLHASLSAEERHQLAVYSEIRARVMRARAGANLSKNEERIYQEAIGGYSVERLREALDIMKRSTAEDWNASMAGLSGNGKAGLYLLEMQGKDTVLNPNARWRR